MSHDIVADGLNQMMNALRAHKTSVSLKFSSKLLLSVLAIAKLKGYVKSYSVEDKILKIEFDKLNACNAIKPRFVVKPEAIDKFVKRYLPAKEIGLLIVSTSKGLMTHQTALDKNIGGCLIAYFY
jgi:small subunit ribosomal protein S8